MRWGPFGGGGEDWRRQELVDCAWRLLTPAPRLHRDADANFRTLPLRNFLHRGHSSSPASQCHPGDVIHCVIFLLLLLWCYPPHLMTSNDTFCDVIPPPWRHSPPSDVTPSPPRESLAPRIPLCPSPPPSKFLN